MSVNLPIQTDLNPEFVLGVDGPIAKHFTNYESRPPQIQLANTIREAMAKNQHLFGEAGTGTGKSYAFLIPAIEQALRGNKPVVISTNTIALQEQIFRKDIPDLQRYLNLPQLKVVLRKGRNNYLSRRRLSIARNTVEMDLEQQLEDIDSWVEETESGSVQDLGFVPNPELWANVRSDQYDCMGPKCKTYTSCFYFKARTEAEQADIIVTNHALLLQDLKLKVSSDDTAGILPNFKYLVLDEAHALEDAIRKADTFEWKKNSALGMSLRATNRKGSGLLDNITDKMSSTLPSIVISKAHGAKKAFKDLIDLNEEFFEKAVRPFVNNFEEEEITSSKRVKPKGLAHEATDNLLSRMAELSSFLTNINVELQRYVKDREDVEESKSLSGFLALFGNLTRHTKETEIELAQTIRATPDPEKPFLSRVSFVDVTRNDRGQQFTLSSTPIFIKQQAQDLLFKKVPSITLTSATLTVNGSFKHILDTLGPNKDNTITEKLPHVFDYKKQVKLYLTPKLPVDPWNNAKAREEYYVKVSDKIEKYVNETKGNAFILCTSNKLMKALHKKLASKFSARGMTVLLQGSDHSREKILGIFKETPNSVLFAVDSFWTGVDVPGDNLQNVIIPKIPFPPPTPLSEAQEELYALWNKEAPKNKQRNYFNDRVLPAVAIKLQQGFGRLIRHKNDTGIVAILDPRMKTQYYGKALLASLPECRTVIDED